MGDARKPAKKKKSMKPTEDLFGGIASDIVELEIEEVERPGRYDPRNKLNNLTGSEWQFWTKTVISEAYPSNLQHKLRSQHGGQKPPQLCADLIKVFTKEGALVLDPLAGVGGTLIGAALCDRKAVGFELSSKWAEIYDQVCELENLQKFPMHIGNCKDNLGILDDESIDFLLTDVPYWVMDKLKKTRSKNARESKLQVFNEEDLPSKLEWLKDMSEIFEACAPKLKKDAYLAVFIGDMYRGSEYHFLAADLAKEISNLGHYEMKSDIVWVDNSKALHIYGYPFAYIPSVIHQHILIFRKI